MSTRRKFRRKTKRPSKRTKVLRIHAILVSDDDGGRRFNITPNHLRELISRINTIYRPAKTRFAFDSSTDWTPIKGVTISINTKLITVRLIWKFFNFFSKVFNQLKTILCVCPECNSLIRLSELHLRTKGKAAKT